MSDYTYLPAETTQPASQILEITPDAEDWRHVLELTKSPKRVFISVADPIMMVDAAIEQLTPEQLKTFVDELVWRTKLFF